MPIPKKTHVILRMRVANKSIFIVQNIGNNQIIYKDFEPSSQVQTETK